MNHPENREPCPKIRKEKTSQRRPKASISASNLQYADDQAGGAIYQTDTEIGTLALNPFTATGHFPRQPPRWPTFLAMLFQILNEGMDLPLKDELEKQYHVIKK